MKTAKLEDTFLTETSMMLMFQKFLETYQKQEAKIKAENGKVEKKTY